jgi:hypothetical protein
VTWIFARHSFKNVAFEVLANKYMNEVALFLDKPVMGSSTWKAILNDMNFINDDFIFKIGDGDNNVWFKPWIIKKPLCDMVYDIALDDNVLNTITDENKPNT